MAKTRLTNSDRKAIQVAIIEHKFKPIEASAAAEGCALAIQARVRAYGSYLATIDAAPDGAFPEVGSVLLNVGGRQIRLDFSRDYSAECRVFCAHTRYGDNRFLLSLPDTDAFGKKVVAWAERVEATKAERSKLRDNVKATLAAFTTFDDLQKGWPEAERFTVEQWTQRPDYTANVPAVAIKELSEALDLPPEIAEAA